MIGSISIPVLVLYSTILGLFDECTSTSASTSASTSIYSFGTCTIETGIVLPIPDCNSKQIMLYYFNCAVHIDTCIYAHMFTVYTGSTTDWPYRYHCTSTVLIPLNIYISHVFGSITHYLSTIRVVCSIYAATMSEWLSQQLLTFCLPFGDFLVIFWWFFGCSLLFHTIANISFVN